jgi:hypothetical protein
MTRVLCLVFVAAKEQPDIFHRHFYKQIRFFILFLFFKSIDILEERKERERAMHAKTPRPKLVLFHSIGKDLFNYSFQTAFIISFKSHDISSNLRIKLNKTNN